MANTKVADMMTAKPEFGFFPDPQRARFVDAQVRCCLADSLDTAYVVIGEERGTLAAALKNLSSAIRAHPVRPGVMALYGDLMPAIMGQDEVGLAEVTRQLALPHWCHPSTYRVVTLDDAELGQGMAERYRRHIQDDPETLISLNAVNSCDLLEGRRRIDEAQMLLERASPALQAEIAALISEIILVESHPAAGELTFHGASSFFIWGALVLNLSEHGSRVKLVEGIVHEAGHSLLHGFTRGGSLTTNTSIERHASPLREDRRPMEGLVHAAYVLARMHFAMGALLRPSLLAAGHITAEEQTEAKHRQVAAARSFRSAATTIVASAEFTSIGETVFALAQSYMETAGGAVAIG